MILSYIVGIGCSLIMAAICAILLVRGTDYMKENHPDYNGEDFLNWETDNDNDKSHYEGDF